MKFSVLKSWRGGGLLLLLLTTCLVGIGWTTTQFQGARYSSYRIVAEYPHDPTSFTQGLVFHGGHLLEGTGEYGSSKLLRVDLQTGKALQGMSLPKEYFGEGISLANGELFQLTWKNRVGFVYDPDTFELLRTVRYAGEGWGLTFDGQSLILSDGSATLRFLDPQTFTVTRRISVRDGNRFIKQLNELEYVEGEIWANVWYEDKIVRIDPLTGRVTGWIDLAGLKPRSLLLNRDAVYNGIAYDPVGKRVFVTGKNWPKLYEIEVVPRR